MNAQDTMIGVTALLIAVSLLLGDPWGLPAAVGALIGGVYLVTAGLVSRDELETEKEWDPAYGEGDIRLSASTNRSTVSEMIHEALADHGFSVEWVVVPREKMQRHEGSPFARLVVGTAYVSLTRGQESVELELKYEIQVGHVVRHQGPDFGDITAILFIEPGWQVADRDD